MTRNFYFIYLFNGLVLFHSSSMSPGHRFFSGLRNSLPFVSYGGSSLLSLFIGEAIIFRIKIDNYLT